MQLITMTSADKPHHDTSEQCITNILPVEVMSHIFGTFLGHGHYRFVAGTCRVFRGVYAPHGNETSYDNAAASVPCAELYRSEEGRLLGSVVRIGLAAARTGRIPVLKWTHGQGLALDDLVFREAARHGQLDVFEWSEANGRHWYFSQGNAAMVTTASLNGHVNILEFLLSHGVNRDAFRLCAFYAGTGGQISVLEWLQGKGLSIEDLPLCCHNATQYGHVEVLDWLLNHGYLPHPLLFAITTEAMASGHRSVVDWAKKNNNDILE